MASAIRPPPTQLNKLFRLQFPFVFRRLQSLQLLLPGFASQLLSRCPPPLSLLRFPLSLQPNFSCLPSRFLYLASLFVSFRSSLLRSHSRSTGAYLPFSLPIFSTSNPLSFVRFSSASSYSASCSSFPSLPGSDYSAPVSSFPLSSRFPLTVGLLRCFPSAFASLVFPVLSDLISHALFPGSSYSAFLQFLSPSPSRLTVATSAPQPSSFRLLTSSPWLSL